MKKSFLCLILTLLLMFVLIGCTGEILNNGNTNDTDVSMEMSYDKFSGERLKTVTLKADTYIMIDIVSNSGDLSVNIADESGKSAYTGSKLPTSSFSVIVLEESTYTIKVEASSHNGSYKISWE